MRLGDLDALIRTHKSEVATIGKDWTVDDLATAIETAPTIPAIPVEWLRDKLMDMSNADEALSKAAWRVMRAWEKEQEAK